MDWELDENKSSESKCVLILEETEETMKVRPNENPVAYLPLLSRFFFFGKGISVLNVNWPKEGPRACLLLQL